MKIWERVLDKLMSGRFIVLIVFSISICLWTGSALVAIISMIGAEDKSLAKDILPILKDILLFLLGAVTGSFNKIFDSYSYRSDRVNPNRIKEIDSNKEKEGESGS